MKADGVRYLCLCPVCGKLGDGRRMVRAGPVECLAHDRCVFEQLGEGILNLPKEERAKFTVAAVGPHMMRRLGGASHKG
jgi:hypothetical protein